MTRRHPLSFFVLGSLALACSASPADPSRELSSLASPLATTGYIDARSYFSQPEDVDRWYELTLGLEQEFDTICGDTFCEGDFSNYQSLGFRCSVERSAGTIGECVWIFAASTDDVAPDTGTVSVDTETWRCAMPLAIDTSAAQFVSALAKPGERALYSPLPGTERVLYDGLIDCL